jgi:hypothetical protein
MREEIREPSVWYSIIEGSFRTQVSQDDPRAVRRDWKGTDGSTGTKYERIVNAVIGYITAINFYDGEYGMEIVISLDKDERGKTPKVSLSTSSREGESFLKRLPNIDFKKEVHLRPFSFTDKKENGEVRGLAVTQPDEKGEFTVKVGNYFYDEATKKEINGLPVPDGDTEEYSNDDWKLYYMQVRKFLITYAKERVVPTIPYFDPMAVGRPTAADAREAVTADMASGPEYPSDEGIKPEDIPF